MQEVQKAYRFKAMRAHPDKPGGSNEAFKELFSAHEKYLDDVSKRHGLNVCVCV